MTFPAFVASGEPAGHHTQWHERFGRLALTPAQQQLVGGFVREINILCVSGTWCGDCALQGAALARIAEANPRIHLRFLLKDDQQLDLLDPAKINAGYRVPVTWFMAEDFEFVSFFGDRTLSRYRSMARKALGPAANVLAPPPADPVREVLDEMLLEVERVHLLLRLSGRFREKHND
ncbi:MAG: thioredoxin family protein [Planctomycetota bacterium]|nr:thioredoxin family protein [Planctomycetota bacterium]